MYDGDWKDLIEHIRNITCCLLMFLNKLTKTIVIWAIYLLPLIIFFTLAFLNVSSDFWFVAYLVLALVVEVIWLFLIIASEDYR